jgi:hypothetical protein
MMVPMSALELRGLVAAAFIYVGMPWAQHIVALGERSQGSPGCAACNAQSGPNVVMSVSSSSA